MLSHTQLDKLWSPVLKFENAIGNVETVIDEKVTAQLHRETDPIKLGLQHAFEG